MQIAKIAGATVIGTVSTQEKADLAKEHGADHVIATPRQDFVAETKKITSSRAWMLFTIRWARQPSKAASIVFAPRGMMVLFGQSSGPVGQIDPQILNQKGSLFLTRPSLAHYVSDPKELQWRASDLFRWIEQRQAEASKIHKVYPLAEAAQAHRDLESRKTTGKLLLKP